MAGYEEGVRYVAAACGDVVSFLLRSDGIVNVSGSTWLGEDTITSPVGFTAVAAGLHHVVLLRCDGMVETYDPSHGDYFGVLGGNGPPGGIGGVVERPRWSCICIWNSYSSARTSKRDVLCKSTCLCEHLGTATECISDKVKE